MGEHRRWREIPSPDEHSPELAEARDLFARAVRAGVLRFGQAGEVNYRNSDQMQRLRVKVEQAEELKERIKSTRATLREVLRQTYSHCDPSIIMNVLGQYIRGLHVLASNERVSMSDRVDQISAADTIPEELQRSLERLGIGTPREGNNQ